MFEFSEAVFKRSKSSHFVGYSICEVPSDVFYISINHYTLFASAVKRISHQRAHKMIKLEAFLMSYAEIDGHQESDGVQRHPIACVPLLVHRGSVI